VSERPLIAASAEIVSYHARQHARRLHDGADPREIAAIEAVCPCGSTLVVICTWCHSPVFLLVEPATWCEHAEDARRAFGAPS
jgi:hypothetical protein